MKTFSVLRAASALCLLAALSSCQTSPSSIAAAQFPAPGADWRSSVGQLQYATPERSVIGEAVVSRNGGQDFQLEYVAGPGVPLMRLRESGAAGSAEGVFARGGWQGVPSQAQGRIASWMSLREVFAAVEASGAASHANVSAPNGAWHAQADLSAQGKPRRIAVDYPQTHERFVFVFGGK